MNVRTGKWGDFATGDRGADLISLAAYLFRLSQADAALRVADMLGIDPYDPLTRSRGLAVMVASPRRKARPGQS